MTWRTFTTRRNAELYALGVWLRMLRRRAAAGDGTLLNVITRAKERVINEWADDDATLRSALAAMTAAELTTLATRLTRLPWLGTDHVGARTESGPSTRWAEPRQTADAQWAVPAAPWDTQATDVEPTWPKPEPQF
jgi:hypothetical protein